MKAQRSGFYVGGGVTRRYEFSPEAEAWRRKQNERSLLRRYGGLAQLGERLPCKQEVSGSNPLISTKYLKKK